MSTRKPDHPFAALAGLRDSLPPGEAPVVAPVAATPAVPRPARAVVRLERKGRAGKAATIIDKLGLSPDELERWCRELKVALGCGGAVDGDRLVIQGDLRPRVEAWLRDRVGKVTSG